MAKFLLVFARLLKVVELFYQATAEANNLSAVNAARELYISLMDCVCGGERPYMNPEQLNDEHLRIRDRAIEAFQTTRKMGGAEFSEMYRGTLEKV